MSIFLEREGKRFVFQGKTIYYTTKPATATILKVEPNTTLIFRQCLPHQGMTYETENIRAFSYIDFTSVERKQNETTPLDIYKRQMLKKSDFDSIGKKYPNNVTNTNL